MNKHTNGNCPLRMTGVGGRGGCGQEWSTASQEWGGGSLPCHPLHPTPPLLVLLFPFPLALLLATGFIPLAPSLPLWWHSALCTLVISLTNQSALSVLQTDSQTKPFIIEEYLVQLNLNFQMFCSLVQILTTKECCALLEGT